MTSPFRFNRLVHSDWSVLPAKRWTAVALSLEDSWLIEHLAPTPSPDLFVDDLLKQGRRTLAGFDFPIGLPSAYLERTGLNFLDLISEPCSMHARRFFTPAETLFDISPTQPFYRTHPAGGRHTDLCERLGCASFDELLRQCDKATENRLRAEAIFWTVGAKQVGKAALCGWREILIPVRRRGGRLWPFDGLLAELDTGGLTIAEAYPAEAYRHIGVRGLVGKRSQQGRMAAGRILLEWASRHRVRFDPDIARRVCDGFGAGGDGEDAFDALAGLCGMIEVVAGRRAEMADDRIVPAQREGWILGQTDLPL
ncbi:DUF429 domain-containing protein [Bradyrhizobium sp. ARR65]|uniref:DUF429 domain-containing protein n=1 Tax=Bradyrhizobium sp. ARR65 TaxID=1040989 RepID=UPI000463A89D|nr:DUF429 domain-containing protein [Bradyrhizobium sp. ARR65]